MNNITKPITVARQEFLDSQVALINNSGLPAFIVADILGQLLASVKQQIQPQYESDAKAYMQKTKKSLDDKKGGKK